MGFNGIDLNNFNDAPKAADESANKVNDKLSQYKAKKEELEREIQQLEINKQVAEKQLQSLEAELKSKLNVDSLDNIDEIKAKLEENVAKLEEELNTNN